MRARFLLAVLCVFACKTEAPTTKPPTSPPTKSEPTSTQTTSKSVTATPSQKAPWPERPTAVMAELRVEGMLPTAQAILNQARKISASIPPIEAMIGIGVSSLLGLSDAGSLNVSSAAGVLLVDTPQAPSPVIYLGISTEEAFRKALPAGSIDGDAKGNALVFTPVASKLGEKPVYMNFIGAYVFGSPSPEAFALAKPYAEKLAARALDEPSVWVSVEVAALLKRYQSDIDTGMAALSKVKTPGGPDPEKILSAMLAAYRSVDEIELRHTPAESAYHLSLYIKPLAGSGFEAQMKKPSPPVAGLEKKLPLGWLGGSFYADPELSKAAMAMMGDAFPPIKELDLYTDEVLTLATGEVAFSLSEGGAVLLSGVKDEAKYREYIRAAFAKEKKISFGTQETIYQALKKDAEELAGLKVDLLESSTTGAASMPAGAPLPAWFDPSHQEVRFAYQPGLVFTNFGTSKAALESMLKGEPSTFDSSSGVRALFGEFPQNRLGAVFFSFPLLMKEMPSLFSASKKPEGESGMALGWWLEAGKYRVEVVVPNAHIKEMIGYFEASAAQ